jgi:hypothetical protein
MTITAAQKQEWREARAQAAAGVGRLNVLYAATARPYRVRLTTYWPFVIPDPVGDPLDTTDPDDPNDLGNDAAADQDGAAPVDGYRPTYRPAGERAESEDEGGEV